MEIRASCRQLDTGADNETQVQTIRESHERESVQGEQTKNLKWQKEDREREPQRPERT